MLAVLFTSMTFLFVYYNFWCNGYKVVINNKETIYVKSMEDVEKAKRDVSKYLLERFDKNLNVDFITSKENTSGDKISKGDEIVNSIYKSIEIEALQLKSDGKDIAVLANEKEINSFVQLIKNKVKEVNKGAVAVDVKSKITYLKKLVSLESVESIENVVNKIVKSEENSLITFNIVNKDNNLSLLTNIEDSKKSNKGVENAKENSKSTEVSSNMKTFSIPTRGVISSAFGMRYHPILGYNKLHTGVDLVASIGTPIISPFDGVISFSGVMQGYGNTIVLKSGDMEVYFGHCSQLIASVNQQIHSGDVIAKVGNTGQSTGPHLHFEVRIDGKPQDPTKYLK